MSTDPVSSPAPSPARTASGHSVPFLKPGWVKKALDLSKGVKKFVQYNQDLMPREKVTAIHELRSQFDQAVKARRKEEAEALEKEMVAVCEKSVPNYKSSALKENVEVIIVAIVIALGIRAYFLQPFKIPTASMQPTLNGITAQSMPENELFPNPVARAFEYVARGRNYVEMRVPQDWGNVVLTGIRQRSKAHFFTVTDLVFQDASGKQRVLTGYVPAGKLWRDLWIGARPDVDDPNRVLGAEQNFEVRVLGRRGDGSATIGVPVAAGALLVRGHVDTGDQVLVNKMAYHFRRPDRGEVFVFNTAGITGITNPAGVTSQHYIKRLVALPGETVQLEPNSGETTTDGEGRINDVATLKINGAKATEFGMERVMARRNNYKGYTTMHTVGTFIRGNEVATMERQQYMAMGDNSPSSSDSRYWGPVPEKNLVGPALVVYWPFLPHFGFIR
ncbi:MAG: signal peptidase [Verrucomicrobiales bacterium]|nr:signal peptidase [Verrucomicrobiales bacterium]